MKTRLSTSKLHFIGIGGIGMSGLAELLHNTGAQVSGSDLSQNSQTTRLSSLGIPVFESHSAENIGDARVVVYSSAITPDNPEYAEAQKRGIPLIARAEALAELMLLKRGMAIAGTHGKTTVTSLISSLFVKAELDPTIVVGGRLECIDSTAQLGRGEWLVAEADESDGSFNRLAPEVVVITNIDDDHLDYYGSTQNLYRAFNEFGSRIPFFGKLVICGDDSTLVRVFKAFTKRKITYGFKEENEYQLIPDQGQYSIKHKGEIIAKFSPSMPGKHNALNTMATLICAVIAGIDLNNACKLIEDFEGVDRRFQFKGHPQEDVDYYDDYGHHPTEIKAVLSAFKEKYPDRRLVVIFQPHRFSRTQSCWADFCGSFGEADKLYLLDIYPASEKPIEGVTTERLAQEIKHQDVNYIKMNDDSLSSIKSELKKGDILVTLGAGDISRWGEAFIS